MELQYKLDNPCINVFVRPIQVCKLQFFLSGLHEVHVCDAQKWLLACSGIGRIGNALPNYWSENTSDK